MGDEPRNANATIVIPSPTTTSAATAIVAMLRVLLGASIAETRCVGDSCGSNGPSAGSVPAPGPDPWVRRLAVAAGGSFCLAVVLFIAFYLLLHPG